MVEKTKYPVRVSRYKTFANMEDRVGEFAEAKIAGFLFRRRIYISCKIKDRKNGFVRRRIIWNKGWGECAVSVRNPGRFPCVEEFNIGSIQVRTELDKALTGREWFYETEKVEFRSPDEMGAFGLGWAAFTVLRKEGAVPGRLTKTGCAKKAIEWLEEYREWKKAGFPEGMVKPEVPKKGSTSNE